jgi:hypothetical protein
MASTLPLRFPALAGRAKIFFEGGELMCSLWEVDTLR